MKQFFYFLLIIPSHDEAKKYTLEVVNCEKQLITPNVYFCGLTFFFKLDGIRQNEP